MNTPLLPPRHPFADSLVNLGKQAFNDYQQSQNQQGGNNNNNNQQQQQHQQQGFDLGGEHLNNNQGQQGNNNNQGGGFDLGDISSIVSHAQNHGDSQNQDSGLFSQVAGFLKNQQGNVSGDIDEDEVVQNHQKVTNSDQTTNSHEIGQAAALNAIKSVLGGSGGGGGGNSQSAMVGAAIAAAGQLFDQKQSQGQASGLKEEAMQSAGQAVMKLMIKNQMSSMIGGGQSGGLGQLAAKFLN
ncbi:hypothetical protein OC842_006454 [Tilletia horrida]|uniref:DUF7721 domain-containing protein n=1 Tax=Tilletia horrida TaxID=155126 RepID=A0AAN6G5G4_9BASI|nr:hypothetical protein OC842_006454 [Tilletia horrida]